MQIHLVSEREGALLGQLALETPSTLVLAIRARDPKDVVRNGHLGRMSTCSGVSHAVRSRVALFSLSERQ